MQSFVIYENDEIIVSHAIPNEKEPKISLGYCYIETKQHLTRLWELNDRQAMGIGLWLKKLSDVHSELLNAKKTYTFKFADITPHIHFHVYPRHPQTPDSIIGEAVRFWKDGPRGDRNEIIKLCEDMRRLTQAD